MRTKFVSILLSLSLAGYVSAAVAEETSSSASSPASGAGPGDHSITVPALPNDMNSSKCSGSLTLGGQGNYPRQDPGNLASADPVMQNMIAATCSYSSTGKITADIWTSTGNGGGANEYDIPEITLDDVVKTPVGTINVEGYASLYKLNLGKGVWDFRDDFVEVYGEMNKRETVHGWTVTPFVRYTHLFATSSFLPDLNFIRAGGRIDSPHFHLPVFGQVSAHAELAHSWNFSPPGFLPYTNEERGEAELIKDFGTFSLQIGCKYTEHVGITPLGKLVIPFTFGRPW